MLNGGCRVGLRIYMQRAQLSLSKLGRLVAIIPLYTCCPLAQGLSSNASLSNYVEQDMMRQNH